MRPLFRVLAIVPAAIAWGATALFARAVVLSDHDWLAASTWDPLLRIPPDLRPLQPFWLVLISVFFGVLFTSAIIRGAIPRWMFQLIPNSRIWQQQR